MKTPLAVIREALLQPVPCPHCGSTLPCRCLADQEGAARARSMAARLDAQAHLVWVALVEHGLIVDQEKPAAPTEAGMEEVAQYLAKASRFARWSGDGWRQLLTSDVDVDLAFTKAKAANEGAGRETTEALARARTLLVAWIEERRAAEGEG